MNRTQFTFYESFFKAIRRIRRKADRADAYDALCAYALYGELPDLDALSDAAAIAFELSKPNLDASRRKAMCGQKGGCTPKGEGGQARQAGAKQTQSKSENETERKSKSKNEKENETETEFETEVESECSSPPPPAENADLAAVLDTFRTRINPTPSTTCAAQLKQFVQDMGAECCLRAFDIAVDAKKATWPYIKAILTAKRGQGVRSLADWDESERRRERCAPASSARGGKCSTPVDVQPDAERIRKNAAWLEEFLASEPS